MLINGREYEWGDISLIVAGVSVSGFRGIKHGVKQEKEHLHTKGYDPQSVQNGNKVPEGELTVTQSVYEALRIAAGGDITKIRNAVIVVAYGDPSQGIPMLTKTLSGVSFTDQTIDWKQGQKFAEVPLPFLYLNEK